MQAIYLDNAATTYPKPLNVVKAVNDCLNSYAVNPRRGHNALVQHANNAVELARARLSNLFAASPSQLVFIPSATFGINLVMQGISLRHGDYIYISPFEHNAVVRCAEHLKQSHGVDWRLLPIDNEMNFDADIAKREFHFNPPALVVITHASNVTGDILPIKPVIELSHQFGAKILVDAAQTVGCYTPSLKDYDYDYLTFSSHKGLYGIPGAGGLIIKDPHQELNPLLFGGTGVNSEDISMPDSIPERFETGTAPLPAIISMLAGVEWIESTGLERIKDKQLQLRNLLLHELKEIYGLRIHGSSGNHRNVGIVSFTSDFYTPQEINMILDSKGICVRSGLHCAPLAHKALGTFPLGVVRVSLSWFNEKNHALSLAHLLKQL